jgi:hypothetical protein
MVLCFFSNFIDGFRHKISAFWLVGMCIFGRFAAIEQIKAMLALTL